MKLIYLHQYFMFPDQPGGTRSYDLAKKFTEGGIKVEVVTTTSKQDFGKKRWVTVIRENIKVHYLYLPYNNDLSYPKRVFVFLKFLYFATLKLLSLKADCVLATSTPLTVGIPAMVKKFLQKTPYIFEVRDVWPEAVVAVGAIRNRLIIRLLYTLERIIYQSASAIVPLSIDMKASILSRYPFLASKPITVIENLAEVNRFQLIKERVDLERLIGFKPTFVVLYAGTFGKVNGLSYMVDLASTVQSLDPGVVFVMIGSGGEYSTVLKYAKSKGVLNKNVFLVDPVSKEELPKWYRSVDMGSSFVIDRKELWSNSANKFFDTLAAARPILINHEGWQADAIRRHNMGYVLPPDLNDKAVQDFVQYTRDAKLHKSQRNSALHVATENYALDVAINKYMKLICRMLKSHRKGDANSA